MKKLKIKIADILSRNDSGQCDLIAIRNIYINSISLGSNNTALLYNEGYIIMFGNNHYHKIIIHFIST